MVTRRRTARPARTVLRVLLCSSMLIGGCSLNENPYETSSVEGDDQVKLIDSMRDNGSFEDARQRLTDASRAIADRIVAVTPGQTWHFTNDPNVQNVNRQGLPCENLTGDIARRPNADTIGFERPFTPDEFATAADIIRQEAAEFGATEDSSLFNEQSKRDFNVQGNGYEFKLLQLQYARLNIIGDCFLMQSVVDLPPGQMPPDPPIVPTATR